MKNNRSPLSAPRGLTALAAACVVFISLPLLAIVIRVPWSQFFSTIFEASAREALWLSLRTSLITTVLAIFTGLPLAWMFAHRTFPFKNILRTICVLPMVLPPVVGGVALIYAFGRRGLIGSTLDDWFGYRIAFTQSATVLAQFFVAAPFFIVVMESAFSQVDASTTWAARTLGAGPWRTLLKVNIPILWPSLIAGIVLTWARALGEFGATITFAGNSPGSTQTLPLAIYSSLESGKDAAVSLSFLMMAISFVVLISLRHRWMTAFQRGAA